MLPRTAKTVKTAKTVMRLPPLNPTPLFRHPEIGWPATEWETGPEPKMAGEMAGELAGGHFSGGFQNGRKMAGQLAGQPKFGHFLVVQPVARLFFGHFGTPPRKMAAGQFAGHFSGHFWFCQPIRNKKP